MGLDFAIRKIDFNGCNARWSYIGFHEFRKRLALEISVPLDDMADFSDSGFGISWDTVNDDIKLLLDHSDCDGLLVFEECKKIEPRLRELVKNWPDEDYDKINALRLADAMQLCVKEEWELFFC